MKFNKDQVQKAVLVGIVAVASLYYYSSELIGPLDRRAKAAETQCADFQKKIDEAKPKIRRATNMEAQDVNAAPAKEAYAVMQERIPSGDPIAWFPTRLIELFRKVGISKQNFRCNPEPPEPKFPGFKASSWMIEFPGVNYTTLGKTIAALENQEALLQITSLQIEATPKEPDHHHVQLTVSTLVKSNP